MATPTTVPSDNPQSQAAPELVPARMLNEYAFCPRLAYLEWVQGEFADSVDTVEGRFQHRRVDRPSGELPTSPSGEAEESEEHDATAPQTIHARSVMLSDETLGAIARIDLVEGQGNVVTPVDYKHGKAPDVAEGAREPERVQLCLQGLLLRANGYICTQGMLYFVDSRERVVIPFDDALVSRTLELLKDLRTGAVSGQIPPPLVDSPKCPRCSLVGICLPDEVNLLSVSSQSIKPDDVRRMAPARDDAMPLYVQSQGAVVGKSSDQLEVKY
ncbi:MAG TPA: CRISPR-associated protein Cas4, partial [Dehalococcoidia bacterium]|nr:CRISPR-associated protein Cas4 [Dehalococcoidia bacterium]